MYIGLTLRRDGRTWRAVARYRDGDRVRQRTKAMASRRKGDASAEAAAWYAGLVAAEGGAQGQATAAPRARPQTVAGYVAAYVERLGETGSIEASTLRGYRHTVKLVADGLGETPLGALTPGRAQQWEAEMTGRGLSSSTVGKAHRLVKQALKAAVMDGRIERNPMEAVRPPKRRNAHEGINALDASWRAWLLSTLDAIGETPVTVAARLALWTGLREGEVCGLQWGDADLAARTLWVRRSVGVGDGGRYVKAPKTNRARDVAMPEELAGTLAAWRDAGGPWAPGDFVLSRGPEPYSPTMVSREWAMLARLLDLKGTEGRRATFHDLRHIWATMAVAAGVDIKTVASNLGHANAAMTLNVYASADPDAKRRAAEVIGRAMRGEA